MIKKLLLTLFLICSLVISSYAACTVATSYETGWDATTYINGETGDSERVAQSFSHSSNFSCGQVSVYIFKTGSPTDNIIAEIQTNGGDGYPSGTLVDANATKAIDASTIGASSDWVDFTFPASFTLNASTTYHLVLRRSGAWDDSNAIAWRVDVSSPTYANGNWERRNSGTWVNASGAYDFIFKIWDCPAEVVSGQVIWIE